MCKVKSNASVFRTDPEGAGKELTQIKPSITTATLLFSRIWRVKS